MGERLMSSPDQQTHVEPFVARLSHDLANLLLPLRAVADLPPLARNQPENIERLWLVVDEVIVQLTRMTEELRSLGTNGKCAAAATESKSREQASLPHRH